MSRPRLHHPPAVSKALIYALFDPRDPDVVRYIGKTIKALPYRLINHISEARRAKDRSHKLHWIRLLLAQGVQPEIRLLEECDEAVWSERECYWIAQYRDHQMTNGNSGGRGGHIASEAARERLRLSQLGKKASPEARENMRRAHLGKRLSAETRAKLVLTNGPRIKAYAEARRGKPNPEHAARLKANVENSERLRAMRRARIGLPVSEETRRKLSEATRLAWAEGRRSKGEVSSQA